VENNIEKRLKTVDMKRFSVLLMLVVLGLAAKAQQDPQYGLYMFNGLFMNPAYAGSHEVVDAMAIYRHQWAGIEGAPRTGNGSIHGTLKRNQYGLGLTLQGDRLGLTQTFGATGSFAYRLKVGKTAKIALGISAGFQYYRQGNSQVSPELTNLGISDNVFVVDKNLYVPNMGFGVYAYDKRWFVGASVPHLLPTTLSTKVGVSSNTNVARQYNHYLLTAGYLFGKETAVVKFKPSILVKYVPGLNKNIPDFDLSLGFFIVDRFLIGGTCRLGTHSEGKYGANAAIIYAMAKITNHLKVGYAYEQTLTDLRKGINLGTHDVMIGYEFNSKNRRFVSPRFVSYF
jgi:type IX secretion system PorP/SprF family membrane protein